MAFEQRGKIDKKSATCIIVEFTAMGGQRQNLIYMCYGSIILLDYVEIAEG